MDREKGEWPSPIPALERKSMRRDLPVFMFFFMISFIFWYLNSLRNDLEATVRYPVEYINLQEDKVLVNNPPRVLAVGIKGQGYSLLKIKMIHAKHTITVDLSMALPKKNADTLHSRYFFETRQILPQLSDPVRSGIAIFSVKPDTIFFVFEKKNNNNSGQK